MADVDKPGALALHSAHAEEDVAEGGIACVGDAFGERKAPVIAKRYASRDLLRQAAWVAECDFRARHDVDARRFVHVVVAVDEHIDEKFDEGARRIGGALVMLAAFLDLEPRVDIFAL